MKSGAGTPTARAASSAAQVVRYDDEGNADNFPGMDERLIDGYDVDLTALTAAHSSLSRTGRRIFRRPVPANPTGITRGGVDTVRNTRAE